MEKFVKVVLSHLSIRNTFYRPIYLLKNLTTNKFSLDDELKKTVHYKNWTSVKYWEGTLKNKKFKIKVSFSASGCKFFKFAFVLLSLIFNIFRDNLRNCILLHFGDFSSSDSHILLNNHNFYKISTENFKLLLNKYG